MHKLISNYGLSSSPIYLNRVRNTFYFNSSIIRRCFSTNAENKDGIPPNETKESSSTSLETAQNILKEQNLFLNKSGCITFVVDYPLFPLSKYNLTLNEAKLKVLAKSFPKYVSAVIRKPPQEDSQKDQQINKENQFDSFQNVTDQFYSMGAYCSIEFNQKSINTITLNSLYRIHLNQIVRYKLPDHVLDAVKTTPQLLHENIQAEVFDDENQANINDGQIDQIISKREARLKFLIERTQKTIKSEDPMQEEEENTFLISKIKPVQELDFVFDITLEAKLKHLIDFYTKILFLNRSSVPLVNYNLKDAYRILDSLGSFLASSKFFKNAELQDIFERLDIHTRLDGVHSMMRKYYNFLEHFADLGQIAQQNISARRAKEFYDEVFRIVKGAVEGDKGKNAIIDRLRNTLYDKKPPMHVKKIFDDEAKRFYALDETSTEANMIRSYLEWIVALPYGVRSHDDFDIEKAKVILDEDHYGLEEIKDRILEFIAVGKMKGSLKGKILCLVGPPGVGKTSLAGSIARALGRKYSRIALGGESDSSVLKGHRRTYIGSYPGKIIQSLKECATENCVILLDEIDKLGRSSYHGDPQSNLLEILDPGQNSTFTDNYLDFPVDLSNVLFICSANITDTISAPLLDRMDVVHLSSYTNEEKKNIYQRHLLPRAIAASGLADKPCFQIKNEVINILVNEYAREAGVRSLEKYIKKILEKIAFQVVQSGTNQEIIVSPENLIKYIGHPRFSRYRFYEHTPPGVAIGLAYTEYGGSLIYLEATQSAWPPQDPKNPSRSIGGLKITGSLGNVMKESMQIAYSYAKIFLHEHLNSNFFEKNEIHIHAPEGATPKDGPSAGITITTALLSLALNTSIKQSVGMTGEISLRGKVLKIGGVKEKILAAKREGLTELIFPRANKENVEELKKYITEGLTIQYVDNYDDVFRIVFPDLQEKYLKKNEEKNVETVAN